MGKNDDALQTDGPATAPGSAKKGGLKGVLRGPLRPVILKGLVIGLLTVGILGAVWGLEKYFRKLERFQVYSDTLLLEKLPPWVTPVIRAELADLKGIPEKFSIVEPGICGKIAQGFQAIPWVESVVSVRRVFPNRMVVDLKLRRPIVGVKVGKFQYLTDARGYRLSGPLRDWPSGSFDLPLVVTRTVDAVPERGERWKDFGVLSGVAVQTYLLRAPLQTRIKVIDLTNLDGKTDPRESEVVLWTERNTRIDWGRSPLRKNSPGEICPTVKIAKMVDFEKRNGPMSLFGNVKVHYDEVLVDGRVPSARVVAAGG